MPQRHRVALLGFTRTMHELLAIADVIVSKPGGLSSLEKLAGHRQHQLDQGCDDHDSSDQCEKPSNLAFSGIDEREERIPLAMGLFHQGSVVERVVVRPR